MRSAGDVALDEQLRKEQKLARAILAGSSLIALAVTIMVAWAAKLNQQRWEAFKLENACKKVAVVKGGINISPSISTGIVSVPNGRSGVGTIAGTSINFDDDKTGWLCKDGVTYWR